MSLDQAVTAMSAAATDDLVGLVIRWNGDDSKVRTLWSEPANTNAHPDNPQAGQRTARLIRFNDDQHPDQGTRVASPVADITGYHAEEIMISCWPGLIAAVGLLESQIQSVELVLSKSPCYGDAGSSILIVEATPGITGERYAASCSMKLYKFCQDRRNVRFQISYISMAGAHAITYNLNRLGKPTGIRELMTAEEARLSGPREAFAALNEQREAQKARRATLETEFAQLTAQMKDRATSPQWKRDNAAQVEQKKREISRLGQSIGNDLPLHEARGQARMVSLAQAQIGIAKLQSLVNVDVVRWGYMQRNPDLRRVPNR